MIILWDNKLLKLFFFLHHTSSFFINIPTFASKIVGLSLMSLLFSFITALDDNRAKLDFTQKNCTRIKLFSLDFYQQYETTDFTTEPTTVIPCEFTQDDFLSVRLFCMNIQETTLLLTRGASEFTSSALTTTNNNDIEWRKWEDIKERGGKKFCWKNTICCLAEILSWLNVKFGYQNSRVCLVRELREKKKANDELHGWCQSRLENVNVEICDQTTSSSHIPELIVEQQPNSFNWTTIYIQVNFHSRMS